MLTLRKQNSPAVSAGIAPIVFRPTRWILFAVFLFVVGGLTATGTAQKAPSRQQLLLRAAAQMRKADADLARTKTIPNRVRALSWTLLVGELASGEGSPELHTAAVDAFVRGTKQLKELEAEIERNPAAKKLIDSDPKLAMRLDTVRVRLNAIQKKAQLSRAEERKRLEACRRLIRSYRSLTANLAASHARFLMGDIERAERDYSEAAGQMQELRKIVSEPRMHWLFKDEPRLDSDQNTEVVLVLTPAAPFNDDMVAHLKALQSLSAYRKVVKPDSSINDAELLQKARQWAVEADEAGGKTATAAISRVIPTYVLAQIDRCRALQLTRTAPLSAAAHQQAATHLSSAKKYLDRIAGIVASDTDRFAGIREEVARNVEELRSPAIFLQSAARLSAQGRAAEAFAELGRGLAYHRSRELVLARAEVGCRDPKLLAQSLKELKQAAEAGLLSADDPFTRLIQSKCELTAIRDRMTGRAKPAAANDRAALRKTLGQIQTRLTSIQTPIGPNDPLRARLNAYRAVAAGFASVLSSGSPTPEQKSALQRAGEAAGSLVVHLKALEAGRQNPGLAIALREDLVAARIAQGQLAVRVLPDYRDTSKLAFTAAMDRQSELPGSAGNTGMLGSVLLETLLNRPDAQSSRLALEERQLRLLMMQFTEGLFSLYWDQPEAASDRISKALDRLRGASGKPAVDLGNASNLLSNSARADATTDVLESVVAFSTMGHVSARRARRGLAVILNHSSAGPALTADNVLSSLDRTRLAAAVAGVKSPLTGYALGLALESTVLQQPQLNPATAGLCRQFARTSQQRVAKLLAESPALRERYRFLRERNALAVRRLTSQQPFLASASRLGGQFRFEEARAAIRGGLLLHPKDPRLLTELFRLTIDRVAILDGQSRKKALEDSVNEIDRQQAGAQPALAFNAARILDMYGRRHDALAAYRVSLRDQAASREQRIVAESRIALLSALLAVRE